MKYVKYTLAALAVIAMASVSTVKADALGTVILGVFNTSNSLEFDLGTYGSLTPGESWNLGNVGSTLGDTGSDVSFSLAAASQNISAQGGLPKATIAVAGINIPNPGPTPLTSEEGAINSVESDFTAGTSVTPAGTGYTEDLQSGNPGGSYAEEDNGNGFGLVNSIDEVWTGNDTADLYTLSGSTGVVTEVGVFSTTTVGGDTTLTFEAVPEPSAYALGIVAVALFWVLKRRSSTVA